MRSSVWPCDRCTGELGSRLADARCRRYVFDTDLWIKLETGEHLLLFRRWVGADQNHPEGEHYVVAVMTCVVDFIPTHMFHLLVRII